MTYWVINSQPGWPWISAHICFPSRSYSLLSVCQLSIHSASFT